MIRHPKKSAKNDWFSRLLRKSRGPMHRRARKGRRLRGEALEARQMLAADIDTFRHNAIDPEDVNNDGAVSSLDALVVINAMGRQQRGQSQGDGDLFTDVNNDGQRSALDALRVINRIGRDGGRGRSPQPQDPTQTPRPDHPPQDPTDPTEPVAEVRSIDGTGNNPSDESLGAAGEQLIRFAEADYADGISDPTGEDRPSTREISNLLSDSGDEREASERDLSAFIYIWGQFLDHDIDLTESQDAAGESFAVDVPLGDPLFDPFASGDQVIPLTRSQFDIDTGTSTDNPRQQINFVTSYIDGSMVYGSDQETADGLRSFVGGKLLISDSGLLPTADDGHVVAGDIRAAENLSLTAMHALFVREHNRLATQIEEENPNLSDEEIYQEARAIVIGEIQAITFNEFLPALLGRDAISDYQGYDGAVDPSIANEFSTAAFRFGHSTLNDEVYFIGNDGDSVSDEVSLAEAFFNPSYLDEVGIDSLLKSGASLVSQEIDLEVVDSLRNFLFGPPGAGGLDLVALNIQRGRDHGLDDYNSTRAAYGLDPVESIAEITSDVELQGKLETLYGGVDNIDLWVGLMAEDHLDDSSVGELTSAIIVDQFERLRTGDRLWYENLFDGKELRQINQTSLADVIEQNTGVEGLQDDVFFFTPEIAGRVLLAGESTQAVADLQGGRRRGPGKASDALGAAGLTIQLLDAEGEVVAETLTDDGGRYRFDSLTETGGFQVRMAEVDGMEVVSNPTLDVQIAAGDTRYLGMDFEVMLA